MGLSDLLDHYYKRFQEEVATKCQRIDGVRIEAFIDFVKTKLREGEMNELLSDYRPVKLSGSK